ncbi:17748_t:CDS:2, partial [Acaulospora morrowiae]
LSWNPGYYLDPERPRNSSNHTYSFEEFKLINKQLETRTLESTGNLSIYLTLTKSESLFQCHRPLTAWSVEGRKSIRAPDVSFTPDAVSSQLTELQRWTFQGGPFTPTFIVEVRDTEIGTFVQLGWLIDPKNRKIWVYKRNQHGNVFCREHAWKDLKGDNILPEFTLKAPLESSSENLQIDCPECDTTYSLLEHYVDEHARI